MGRRRLVIPDVTKATLRGVVLDNVEPGLVVSTDELISYRGLDAKGYTHKSVTHRLNEYVSGDSHVNGMENFWKHLKGSINGTHMAVSKKHLGKYAKEFEFRFNRREKPASMFPALTSVFPQPST